MNSLQQFYGQDFAMWNTITKPDYFSMQERYLSGSEIFMMIIWWDQIDILKTIGTTEMMQDIVK